MNIDENKLAEYLAEKWFQENIESKIHPKDLYETDIIDFHGLHVEQTVKDQYARLYFDKLEEYKQIISIFETD